MIALVLLHALVATVCLVPGRRSARWAFKLAALAPLAGFVWLVTIASSVTDGEIRSESVEWVPSLGLVLDFRLDGWALLMGLLVFGIGTLVLLYSDRYFPSRRDDLGRIAGLLVAFAGAMWGLVAADGLFTLFLFWELTSITSFLLIGLEDRSAAARAAATRAFLVTGAGGLALLGGLLLIGLQTGETTISAVLAEPPVGGTTNVALVLVLAGCFAKSAQFPLHFWLPGAMAAPTPISAYLHSATMVKAGLVVVARFAPVFGEAAPWRPMIVTAGAISLLLGGLRALRQQDAKVALAHGTVSQLGLLMLLLGLGTPGTTYAGVALLTAHALFKASLFLNIGVVDHEAGTRDFRRLRGLLRALPVTAAATITAGASMAAIPPTFGFVAKEKGLAALLDVGIGAWGTITLWAVVLGSALTVAYTIRLLVGVFSPDAPGTTDHPPIDPTEVHRPTWLFVAAPVVLAVLSLAFGIAAGPVGDWIGEVATSLDPASAEYHLVLWPGINAALGLSVLTWVLGTAVWAGVRRAEKGADAGPGFATGLWDRGYDGLLIGSRRITAVTQSGSLVVYMGVVLGALVATVAAAAIVSDGFDLGGIPVGGSPEELVATVIAAILTVGVLTARRRFTAALLVGAAGYALALVFLEHGAPDLALTQFLVESLVVVIYLLVLVRMPAEFPDPPSWAPRVVRIAIATATGLGLAAFAVATSTAQTGPSVGQELVELSEPVGGGRNVVNVILVDFRGWDTLGEIAVLAIAAGGVINLATVASSQMRERGLFISAARDRVIQWVDAPTTPRRSVIFSATVRGLVPILVILSVYVTFKGHNAPGGGFIGGLIATIAVALRYLADGAQSLRRLRIDPVAVMGVGLLLAVAVAAFPLLTGGLPMESEIWRTELPLLGEVKLVSSALFDIGVFLVVVGSLLGALRALVDADEAVADRAAPGDGGRADEAAEDLEALR